MTPKQKAKELVDSFRSYVDCEIIENDCYVSSKKQETNMSKKCALIVVDELIKETNDLMCHEGRNSITDREYWAQVKTEIEKL